MWKSHMDNKKVGIKTRVNRIDGQGVMCLRVPAAREQVPNPTEQFLKGIRFARLTVQ